MNTELNAIDLMKRAREAGYARAENASFSNAETPESSQHLNINTPQLTADELYTRAAAIGKKIKRQTEFIREGKTHPTKSRVDLLAAARVTLADLTAVSNEISPRSKDGYTDPNDPMASDCLVLWRNEIELLEAGTGRTGF